MDATDLTDDEVEVNDYEEMDGCMKKIISISKLTEI